MRLKSLNLVGLFALIAFSASAQQDGSQCVSGEGGCGSRESSDTIVEDIQDEVKRMCYELCDVALTHCGMTANNDPDLLRGCSTQARNCSTSCSK